MNKENTLTTLKEAHEECPRFEKCGVNRCPLHKNYKKLQPSEFDLEQKCSVAKSIRLRIGKEYKLSNLGLTEKELSARKRWENMPLEKQEAIKERMRKTLISFKKSKQAQPDSNSLNAPMKSLNTKQTTLPLNNQLKSEQRTL